MNEMPNSKPCRKDLLMQIGHASFAVEYFEKLIKLDPNNSLAKKALGLDEEQQAQ